MNKKLKYLTSVSLKRKIKTKWFAIVNILLLIMIVGLINIDSVIKAFGGQFDEKQKIFILDNTNKSYEILKKQNDMYSSVIKLGSEKSDFDIEKANEEPSKILKQKKNKNAWVIEINNDNETAISVKLTSNDYISAQDYATLNTIMNNTKKEIALKESNIDKKELDKISNPIKIERKVLDQNKTSKDENAKMVIEAIFPVFILPFFALTIFLVQMIGAEVNDEKTTRGMEIIISNVSPKTHLMSKVIAGNLFVIIQGTLLVLFAIIGFITRIILGTGDITEMSGMDIGNTINDILTSNIASQFIYIIPLTLIMMALTFIAYSLLAGVLASMTTNIEDFQQLQTPIMIISLVGYYLAIMAGVFEGSLFIKVLAFVPFISAILAPCLLVLGQFSITSFIIAILLVIVVIYLLIKYGFKIYKEGILNYSSKDLWKKMFKALKNK